MPSEKEDFGILWRPDPQTLLVHENVYDLVEPIYRAVMHVSTASTVIPPVLNNELQSVIMNVITECGLIAITWITWLLKVLWLCASKVVNFGAFTVQRPVFVFDQTFGSDTSHRARVDVT